LAPARRRLLHRVDHPIANTHVPQIDQVIHLHRLSHSIGPNMRRDHVIGQSGLRHRHHILRRHRALHLPPHPGLDLRSRTGHIGIDVITDSRPRQRPNRSANRRPRARISRRITHQRPHASTRQPAEQGPAVRIIGRPAADECEQTNQH
jgi:hypothetical protein